MSRVPAPTTELEALRQAWRALQAGNYEERDRLVEIAERLRRTRGRLLTLRDDDPVEPQ